MKKGLPSFTCLCTLLFLSVQTTYARQVNPALPAPAANQPAIEKGDKLSNGLYRYDLKIKCYRTAVLNHICTMTFDIHAEVFEACRRNDRLLMEKLFATGAGIVHLQDTRGFTPLIMAAYNNAPDVVAFLLEHGASIAEQDNAGNTALMGVCFRGYAVLAALLMKAGAEVNQRNYSGATALTFAATFGQLEIATHLLEHGADTELRDANGKTPLDHAMIQENHDMVNLIRKYRK